MGLCWDMSIKSVLSSFESLPEKGTWGTGPFSIFFTFAFLPNTFLSFFLPIIMWKLIFRSKLVDFPFFSFVFPSLRKKHECGGATENSIRNSNPFCKQQKTNKSQGNVLWKTLPSSLINYRLAAMCACSPNWFAFKLEARLIFFENRFCFSSFLT